MLTIAPESSERLRKILGKESTDDQILNICQFASKLKFDHVKLYFIIGLPGETKNDLDNIIQLIQRVSKVIDVYVSINPWVKKPNTPMQWFSMMNLDELKRRIKYIEDNLRGVRITVYDPKYAILQAFLSMGTSDVSKIIVELSKFKTYTKMFNYIMDRYGELVKKFLFETKSVDYEFHYNFVEHFVSKKYLAKQFEEYCIQIRE